MQIEFKSSFSPKAEFKAIKKFHLDEWGRGFFLLSGAREGLKTTFNQCWAAEGKRPSKTLAVNTPSGLVSVSVPHPFQSEVNCGKRKLFFFLLSLVLSSTFLLCVHFFFSFCGSVSVSFRLIPWSCLLFWLSGCIDLSLCHASSSLLMSPIILCIWPFWLGLLWVGGSSYSTVVKFTPRNREFVGLIPAGYWYFFSFDSQ